MRITRAPHEPATRHDGYGPYAPATAAVPHASAPAPAAPPPAPLAPPAPPVLLRRRAGVLPAVAGALSVGGTTLTCTGAKSDVPPELHPLVAGFLAALPVARRSRGTGRCPEALLLSRHLAAAEAGRRGRAARKPLTDTDARRALKHAVVTLRVIREDGDPAHGGYTPPCPACAALLNHYGVRATAPEHP